MVNLDDGNARFVRLLAFLDLVPGDHCTWQVQYFGDLDGKLVEIM